MTPRNGTIACGRRRSDDGQVVVRLPEQGLIAVDLFAGAGGLSLGCQQAGLSVVAAFDSWNAAVTAYNANLSHPCFLWDLSDPVLAAAEISRHRPEMIVGGPPCTDFSSAGLRDEGTKANLTRAFANTVAAVRPEWFIMENVERATLSQAYKEARDVFAGAGYGLSENVLDASLCGVPQKRKRFFCVGRLGEKDGFLDAELKTGLAAAPMSLRDYFGDELGVDHYYRHPRNYARRSVFSIDEPSPTIRGVNRPVPPGHARHAGDTADPQAVAPLTLGQRAQIQTFPKDFIWLGTKTAKEQMIGNAVPVALGRYVASAVMRYSAQVAASNLVFDKAA